MPYNNKLLKYDSTNRCPVPQFFVPADDAFQPATGQGLGNDRFGADNLMWGKTAGGLYVPVQVGDTGKMQVDAQLSGSSIAGAAVLNVTMAGTRVRLPDLACREVTVIAKRANTGYIYAGKSDVSSTVYGVELGSKDSFTFAVNNANEIYIDSSVNGEGISYVAL